MIKVTAALVERLINEKERIKSKIESLLDNEEVTRARSDHHSRREPIACGMTIHTSIGCSYGCIYCYVPDMGFPMNPKPYPLSGLQLVYALASNPFFVPGLHGTLLAYGSVTEPFMPEAVERTLEYMRETWKWLKNPVQVSTKSFIDSGLAKTLRSITDPYMSVLVSITTIKMHRVLEPNAPPPQKRFETIANLSRHGFHVTLFLRPIIPGVTDKEIDEIVRRAAEAGTAAVVPGSLRVTKGILLRLRLAGISVEEVMARVPHLPRNDREQVPIRTHDIKELVRKISKHYGLKVLPSSCSANIDAHRLACWACKWGPCGDTDRLPVVDREDLAEAIEVLVGKKPENIRVRRNHIVVKTRKFNRFERKKVAHWLSTLTKRDVRIDAR